MARTINTLSIVAERFATIRIPRITRFSTHYFHNIGSSRSIQPITVIKTSRLNLKKSLLYDVATGELLKDWKSKKDTWFVIDGQERLKEMILYYAETGDNSFLTIEAIVEDIDNIPDGNIIKYMTD